MSMLKGLKTTNPPQMPKGNPKPASSYPSVDSDATRASTAKSPKSLGSRDA
jgi:hypothetical protein